MDPNYRCTGLRMRVHWVANKKKEEGIIFRYGLYTENGKKEVLDDNKKPMLI